MRDLNYTLSLKSTTLKPIAVGMMALMGVVTAGCGSKGSTAAPAAAPTTAAVTTPVQAVLASVVPPYGYTGGGTLITLSSTGSTFQASPVVTVGGNPCTVVSQSASTITCTTTAGTTGAASVIVTNSGASASSPLSGFTYQPNPTINSVSPSGSSMAPGTVLTLSGYAFYSGGSVSFGAPDTQTCTGFSPTPDQTSATCTVAGSPPTVTGTPEPVDVIANNGCGGGCSNTTDSGGENVNSAPTISSLSPNNGALAGTNTITINGNFTSPSTATIGGTACTFTAGSYTGYQTSFNCTVPAQSATSCTAGVACSVVVTDADSQATAPYSGYTYNPAPTLSAIERHSDSATHGSAMGAYRVDLVGTGFLSGMTATVGGNSCASLVVDSATTAHCTVALHAAGTVTGIVSNSDGQTSAAGGSYRFDSMMYVAESGPTVDGGEMAANGTLTHNSSTLNGGADVVILATNPKFAKVYVATDASRNIHSYSMGGDGTLTYDSEVQTAVGKTYASSNSLVVAPNGNFALLSSGASGVGVIPIPINSTTHDLSTPGSAVIASDGTSTNPLGVAIDNNSAFAWVAYESGSALCSFSTNSTSGALVQLNSGVCLSGANTPGNLSSVAVSANNQWLFGVGNGNGHVFSYTSNAGSSGIPTELAETALSAGTGALQVLATSNNFLYVVNNNHTSIGYSVINPSTGDLTSDGTTVAPQTDYPISSMGNIAGISADPSGSFLYVADSTNNNVRILTIGADGALSEPGSAFTGGGALASILGLSFSGY